MPRNQAPPKANNQIPLSVGNAFADKRRTSSESMARLEALKKRYASVIGIADAGLTTDEIMRMTRGED